MKTCKRQFLVLFLLILGLLLTAAGCSSTGGRAVDSDVHSVYTGAHCSADVTVDFVAETAGRGAQREDGGAEFLAAFVHADESAPRPDGFPCAH